MDFNYLIELSNNNAFILKNYLDKNNLNDKKTLTINRKFKNYLRELKNKSWQESQFDNFKLK
jgi:hypothetical protein